MRRHHYLYARNRYLTDPDVLATIAGLHRELAAEQARELGLLDPDGPGSWTHPDLSRMLHADGKVITPLFRRKPGDTPPRPQTGEILPHALEPDAGLHFEGDGEAAWGTSSSSSPPAPTTCTAASSSTSNGSPPPAAKPAPRSTASPASHPYCPGAQGVIYDTALRGVHHQHLLRDLGLLPINRVTAAKAGAKKPAAARSPGREERPRRRQDHHRRRRHPAHLRLYAQAARSASASSPTPATSHFVPLPRIRTHRNRDKNGQYRWYNDYQLPDRYDDQRITVRLHGNDDDAARKFNRTENLRPIPPGDPDFERLFPRRNDAESINRNLDDTMWLGRAHSIGHARQQLNLLGFALTVNSLALHRHRRRRAEPLAA